MITKPNIENYFLQSQIVIQKCLEDKDFITSIGIAGDAIANALRNGKKVISCGNGGSMADAMHFASELVGKYQDVRDPLPAIALSDVAAMTCISNDFGYEVAFRRQIVALGNVSDVLLAISTSGRSANVVNAVVAAKRKGMTVVALTGMMGMEKTGNSFENADYEIKVPSTQTGFIQQCHGMIIHLLCEIIEDGLK